MQLLIPLASPNFDENLNNALIELEEFDGKMTLEYAAIPFLESKKINKIIIVIHSDVDKFNGLSKVLKKVFKEHVFKWNC